MRFLFCKLQCPSFICLCKPSPPHIYDSGPLKLETSPHVPPPIASVSDVSQQPQSHQLGGEATGETDEQDALDEKHQHQTSHSQTLKSSLKKASSRTNTDNFQQEKKKKKQVQWMDFAGKELAEIREFESSEAEEDYGDHGRNMCVIL